MSGDEPHIRLTELERRLADQERVIADLNEMVVAQWRKIDSLERRLGELRDEFDATGVSRPDGQEPPPPHY
jgi:SlyX protein